jgi:hypothetical protein
MGSELPGDPILAVGIFPAFPLKRSSAKVDLPGGELDDVLVK